MDEKLTFDVGTAAEYDRGIRRTFPTYDSLFRLIQAYLREKVDKKSDLLIVGGGGGSELALLGPNNPAWTFTVVDPAPAMLDMAKEKATHLQVTDQASFIEGTVHAVEEHVVFDAATMILVLHFIADDQEKLSQLQAIRKRLTKGAPFVLAAMYGDRDDPEFETLFQLWKAYWFDTTALSKEAIDDMAKTIQKLSFVPEQGIEDLLLRAGFGQVTKFFQTNMIGAWVCVAEGDC